MKIWVAAAIQLTLLLFWGPVMSACATDAEILLQFYSSVTVTEPFAGWTAGNSPYLCSNWTGVTCDTQNRVVALKITNPSTTNPGKARGLFSNVLTQLPALQQLSVRFYDFYGIFPPEYFQMPSIQGISLVNVPLTIQFPTSISPNLAQLVLNGVNLTTSLPDIFPWTSMNLLYFKSTGLKCPLPAGLVSSWTTTSAPSFSGTHNLLDITAGSVCDQISVYDIPGSIYPTFSGVYVSGSRAPRFMTQNDNIAVEFLDNEVRLYGLSQENKTNILRDRYIALNLQPTQQLVGGTIPKLFSIQAFDSFAWTVPNTTLEANLTIHDAVSQQFVLSLRLDFTPTSDLVTFSYRLYTSVTTTPSPPSTTIDVAFTVKFYTQHSAVGELMPNCTTTASGGMSCSSTWALIQSSSAFTMSGITYIMDEITPNVTNSLSFLPGYIVDGAPPIFSASSPTLSSHTYFDGLATSALQARYSAAGVSQYIPRVESAQNQSVTFSVVISMGQFQSSFESSFSLSLKLASSGAPSAEGPAPSSAPIAAPQTNVVFEPMTSPAMAVPQGAISSHPASASAPVGPVPTADSSARVSSSMRLSYGLEPFLLFIFIAVLQL